MVKTASRNGKGAPYSAVIDTPLPGGERLGLCAEAGQLSRIAFLPPATALRAPQGAAMLQWVRQLEAYFENPAAHFSLPLAPGGSGFRRRVWTALQAIAPGATLRYGELARQLGSSARAVGGACRDNPLPIVVPCHRVVAAGSRGGFMGATAGRPLAIKQWLLEHERGA